MPSVYLAGPIAGLDYAGATDWREHAKALLGVSGITAYSPMRAKNYLANIQSFGKDSEEYGAISVLSSNRGIMTRDRFDATRVDLILANLLGAKAVSIGTMFEMAWADICRVPIVCIIESDGSNPHEHGMVKEAVGFRVPKFEEAINITKAILLA